MRVCSQCAKEDGPWFDAMPCSCGADKGEDPANPSAHQPDCHSLGHEVVMYPIRMAPKDLTFDKQLPVYWRGRGWNLMQNGLRWYRVKMLCRECCEAENGAQARRREYELACRDARGVSDLTYAQMLAQQ